MNGQLTDRTEDLFTVKEASREAGVTDKTIRNWISSGKLKAFKTPGGQLRIRRDALALVPVDRKN